MAAKKNSKRQSWTTLTLQDVKDLAQALLHVGDKYPLKYVTEMDFYPLVEAYLYGRVPKLEDEFAVDGGWIDFKVGTTTNPAYLELAVASRQLVDRGISDRETAESNKTELYGSKNKTELQKLSTMGQSKAKGRFILLLDLWGVPHDFEKLKATYTKQEAALPGSALVNVIYVGRGMEPKRIMVSKAHAPKSTKKTAKKTGKKTAKKTAKKTGKKTAKK